jgi:cytochrome c oxidase subunit 2
MTTDIAARAILAGAILVAATAGVGRSQPPTPRVIHVTAERFTFTPSRIIVEPGEAIELRLSSDDTAHGFRVEGTDINIVIPKRGAKAATVTFTAPAPGRYTFECTRMCGAGHNFMRGELVVRERVGKP